MLLWDKYWSCYRYINDIAESPCTARNSLAVCCCRRDCASLIYLHLDLSIVVLSRCTVPRVTRCRTGHSGANVTVQSRSNFRSPLDASVADGLFACLTASCMLGTISVSKVFSEGVPSDRFVPISQELWPVTPLMCSAMT